MFRTIGLPGIVKVKSGTFRLRNIQVASGAALSGFVRATGLIAQRWAGDLDLEVMTRTEWQEWESFIARLAGLSVLFEIHDDRRPFPLGTAAGYDPAGAVYPITGTTITGATIVTGAHSALVAEAAPRHAQALRLKGLVASAVVLKHGDLFGLGGNLYLVAGDVTSDASGEARVPFRWRLHKPAGLNDVVNFLRPTCRVQLKSAEEGDVTRAYAGIGRAGVSFVEIPYTE